MSLAAEQQLTPTDAYHAQFAAHRSWGDYADEAIRHLVKKGAPFTSDDVRALIPEEITPTTPNAYGGLFQAWKKTGWIEPVGWTNSTHKKRRRGVQRVWAPTAA